MPPLHRAVSCSGLVDVLRQRRDQIICHTAAQALPRLQPAVLRRRRPAGPVGMLCRAAHRRLRRRSMRSRRPQRAASGPRWGCLCLLSFRRMRLLWQGLSLASSRHALVLLPLPTRDATAARAAALHALLPARPGGVLALQAAAAAVAAGVLAAAACKGWQRVQAAGGQRGTLAQPLRHARVGQMS